MKPKDDLFRLIKSLSRSEKRYFTLDAKKSGAKSSQYLKLFQAINSMNEYDESRFPKGLSNISVGKAYLYEAILKSMRDYRSPKSKRAQLKQRITDAKFLYERGLYDLCAERLESAKKIAEELSDSLALLEINREMRRLTKERGLAAFSKKFEEFKNDKEKSISAVEEEFKYLGIVDFLAVKYSTKYNFTKEEEISDLKVKLAYENWEEPSSIQAKLRFFQSNAHFNNLIGDAEKSSLYFNKSAELWDLNLALKREEYFRYIKDLANAIAFSFRAGKIDLVESYMSKLENETPENFHEENIKFRTLISHRINFVTSTKQYGKVKSLEKEIEEGLLKFDLRDPHKLTIWIQIALLLLASGDHKRCIFWLKKIINFKNLALRQDIQKGARVLHLLLSARHEEYDITELLIRSYSRYFKKYFDKGDAEFENQLIALLKTIIPFPLEKKEKALLLEFYKDSSLRERVSISHQIFKEWLVIENILKG